MPQYFKLMKTPSRLMALLEIFSALALFVSLPAAASVPADIYTSPAAQITLGEDALNSMIAYRLQNKYESDYVHNGEDVQLVIRPKAVYFDLEASTNLPVPPACNNIILSPVLCLQHFFNIPAAPQCNLSLSCANPSAGTASGEICTPLTYPYPVYPVATPYGPGSGSDRPISHSFLYIKLDLSLKKNGISVKINPIEEVRPITPDDFVVDPETGIVRLKTRIANDAHLSDKDKEEIDKVLNQILQLTKIPTKPDGQLTGIDFVPIYATSPDREMGYTLVTSLGDDQIGFRLARTFRFAALNFTRAGVPTIRQGANVGLNIPSYADLPNFGSLRVGGVSNIRYKIKQVTFYKKSGSSWPQVGQRTLTQQSFSDYNPAGHHAGYPLTYQYMSELFGQAYTLGDSAKVVAVVETSQGAWQWVTTKFKVVSTAGWAAPQ